MKPNKISGSFLARLALMQGPWLARQQQTSWGRLGHMVPA
jgi:hypothetical protein